MNNLLIINTSQLGVLTDTLKYCEHLNKTYKIDFLCYDYGLERVTMDNVHVTYVPHPQNRVLQGMLFILYAIIKCAFYKGAIFVVYFPYSVWLKKILFWKKLHIDVRTLSVSKDQNVREASNLMLKKTIEAYDSVSYISEGVKSQIGLPYKKSFVLPLGADVISNINKTFLNIKLLYVGILNNRNIKETLIGLRMFLDKYPQAEITYDIVGYGEELEEIKKYITTNKLENVCTTHGRIDYYKLKPFFDKCNVGVSYIPIRDYYQYQPPTKTFEYGLSGFVTIATETLSNQEVINNCNGILIKDNPSSFSDALELLYFHKIKFDSNVIRESFNRYKWNNIVQKDLISIIEQK